MPADSSSPGQRLAGLVALVSGAGSGIGRATARRLAAEGASVVCGDLDRDAAEAIAADITAEGGTALGAEADIAYADQIARLVKIAVDTYGGLDIAVNGARILGRSSAPSEIEPREFDRIMHTNVRGVFYGMRVELPAMRRRGGGLIVNVTSATASLQRDGGAVDAASEAAVVAIGEGFAAEGAPDGVRVEAVRPARLAAEGKASSVEDVARVIADLAALAPTS